MVQPIYKSKTAINEWLFIIHIFRISAFLYLNKNRSINLQIWKHFILRYSTYPFYILC